MAIFLLTINKESCTLIAYITRSQKPSIDKHVYCLTLLGPCMPVVCCLTFVRVIGFRYGFFFLAKILKIYRAQNITRTQVTYASYVETQRDSLAPVLRLKKPKLEFK